MMSAVANLWLAGVDVDWDRLTGDGQPIARKKVSLPTYAFQRKRYCIEPPVADATTANTASPPPVPINNNPDPTVPVSLSNPTPTQTQLTQPESITMSRIPTIVTAIESVFEDTSGFELSDFDGDTTFFEMGLDSLVLTQTATALKKEMEIEITFRQLLEETPTVDSLAAWFDENLPADKYAAVAVAAPVEAAAPAPAPAPGTCRCGSTSGTSANGSNADSGFDSCGRSRRCDTRCHQQPVADHANSIAVACRSANDSCSSSSCRRCCSCSSCC